MSDSLSEDGAALAAHRIVLAYFVSEAEDRLGAMAPDFLEQIRRAAIHAIEHADGADSELDLLRAKRTIIKAIDEIFSG